MKLTVYDKVRWHYPDGDAPSMEAACEHFRVILEWAARENLLTPFGKELAGFALDEDFSITSDMITALGNQVVSAGYDDWLEYLDQSETCDTRPLADLLDKLRASA